MMFDNVLGFYKKVLFIYLMIEMNKLFYCEIVNSNMNVLM